MGLLWTKTNSIGVCFCTDPHDQLYTNRLDLADCRSVREWKDEVAGKPHFPVVS